MHYFFKADIEYYDDEDNTLHLDPNEQYYFMEPHRDDMSAYYSSVLGHKDPRFGLAEYIGEDDGDIYKKVACIDYKIEKGYCIFTVATHYSGKDKLNEKDIQDLIKYLNGQISDGWGENGHWVSNRYDEHKFVWVRENAKQVFKHPYDDHEYVDTWEEAERIMDLRLKEYRKRKGK